MDFLKRIVKSRAFMVMDEKDELRWHHYLGAFVKLACYILLALFAYYAILGFLDTPPSEDWTPGETYPF